MRAHAMVTVVALGCQPRGPITAVGSPTPVLELRNGHWYDGTTFRDETVYSVYGHLTRRVVRNVDQVIDLHGAYVVPPFGEAHNHNGGRPGDADTRKKYLDAGVFFVKNPDNPPQWPAASRGEVNVPASIDVSFADGGFTAPGGHPAGLIQRNIAAGSMTEADGEGAFYFSVATRADVDRVWSAYRAEQSDFTKVYLVYSEEYAQRAADPAFFSRRGLDPTLVPYIVERAHRDRRRVTAHVDTAADLRAAVTAGVEEIAHLPGFRPDGDSLDAYGDLARYRVTEADARAVAARQVVVVTTVGEVLEMLANPAPDKAEQAARLRELIDHNLRVLRDAHVTIAIGSDRFRRADTSEVDALHQLGVFDNAALLHMWCVDTPRTIFPQRNLGTLSDGAEASFLALDGNPLVDFSATKRIRVRVKQGHIL